MEDSLTMDIEYDVNSDEFKITGDIKKQKQKDLIAEFLRGEIGAGVNNSPPVEREKYHIRIEWYPHLDRFKVSYDTGNKSLRDGILLRIISEQD